MTVLLTPYLKLRVASSLAADAAYNLRRIDTLGAIYTVDSGQNVRIKALGNVSLEPQSSDLGGAGSSSGEIQCNDALLTGVRLDGGLVVQNGLVTVSLLASASQVANLTFTLPPTDGAAGQVLTTDGTGLLTWEDSAASALSSLTVTWTVANGLSKTITHNWNTWAFLVQIVDENGDNVETEIARPTLDTVTLTRSEIPSGNWTILLLKL